MALAAPVINPGSSTITNDPTPTFTGTAVAGTTVELFADGSSLGTTTTDSDGNWSFTVPDGSLSDGFIAITAVASDSDNSERFLLSYLSHIEARPRRSQTRAFAALKEDGSVITWGDFSYGGDSSSVLGSAIRRVQIFSSGGAFAALRRTALLLGEPQFWR